MDDPELKRNILRQQVMAALKERLERTDEANRGYRLALDRLLTRLDSPGPTD